MDARVVSGTDIQDVLWYLIRPLCQITLIIDNNIRESFFPDQRQRFPVALLHSFRCIDDQDDYICFIEHLPCPFHAQFPQSACIIKPRCIDNQDRSQWQQFHGLIHRIGRRPLFIRNDSQILSRHSIDDTRFTGIAAAKKANMYAFT